ncbi:MAG TPA: SPFH domain-containing protein [Bacillota bacterium]|jgi:regulator of protease activity HflC (stomatin/prohibitin superfamily)|nr:SPFH domain-containing protein [Bacillota bacterium]HOL10983.1 SPFH domain-containing protein [Bacillota bacterium]HPO98730.1 SPFH domain-containing protein [Bacillota bacterium]
MIETIGYIGFIGLCIWILLQIFLNNLFPKVTIFDHEKGILYVRGRFSKVLEPGQHRYFQKSSVITKVDMRPATIGLAPQEVRSNDNVPMRVQLLAKYEIVDCYLAVSKSGNYHDELYLVLQTVMQEIFLAVNSSFLKKLSVIEEKIIRAANFRLGAIGLKVTAVSITFL